MTHFFKLLLYRDQIFFQRNGFYYIWLDATRCADSEYHLGSAQNDALFPKIGIWRAKTTVYEILIAPILLISVRWRYGQRWTRRRRILGGSLRSIGPKLFWGFIKYGKTGFQNLVGHRNRLFFEKHLLLYDSMQLDQLIPNITLDLHKNASIFAKLTIPGQKPGSLGNH
jgi:hypothetical protein